MPLDLLYTMVQKKSKMTKNSNQGGPALRTSLVYCRTFGRTAKSAPTVVAEHTTSAGYKRVRRNRCKLIRFTSAVLHGLVFLCQ